MASALEYATARLKRLKAEQLADIAATEERAMNKAGEVARAQAEVDKLTAAESETPAPK